MQLMSLFSLVCIVLCDEAAWLKGERRAELRTEVSIFSGEHLKLDIAVIKNVCLWRYMRMRLLDNAISDLFPLYSIISSTLFFSLAFYQMLARGCVALCSCIYKNISEIRHWCWSSTERLQETSFPVHAQCRTLEIFYTMSSWSCS